MGLHHFAFQPREEGLHAGGSGTLRSQTGCGNLVTWSLTCKGGRKCSPHLGSQVPGIWKENFQFAPIIKTGPGVLVWALQSPFCSFPRAAATGRHTLGGLKQCHWAEIRAWAGRRSLQRLSERARSCLSQHLAAAGIPWLVGTSPQSLPLGSRGLLLFCWYQNSLSQWCL